MRSLTAYGFALALGLASSSLGRAQDAPAERPEPDNGTWVETRTHEVRPPQGSLRRGWLPVPGWVALAVGALSATAAAILLGIRIRRNRQ